MVKKYPEIDAFVEIFNNGENPWHYRFTLPNSDTSKKFYTIDGKEFYTVKNAFLNIANNDVIIKVPREIGFDIVLKSHDFPLGWTMAYICYPNFRETGWYFYRLFTMELSDFFACFRFRCPVGEKEVSEDEEWSDGTLKDSDLAQEEGDHVHVTTIDRFCEWLNKTEEEKVP